MCTVTFIRNKKGIIVASNRDESVLRSHAAMPEQYRIEGMDLIFPKDGQAGGTWIGMNRLGHIMVLLNGAFGPHEMRGGYRKSRGLVFLDIMREQDPYSKFQSVDLDNIEPFALVLWAKGELHDLRWDGSRKFGSLVDADVPHIWSSAMLYTPEVRAQRELWFKQWLEQRNLDHITVDDLTAFHTFGGNTADEENKLVMHRGEILKTISITTIESNDSGMCMHYDDLMLDRQSLTGFKKDGGQLV